MTGGCRSAMTTLTALMSPTYPNRENAVGPDLLDQPRIGVLGAAPIYRRQNCRAVLLLRGSGRIETLRAFSEELESQCLITIIMSIRMTTAVTPPGMNTAPEVIIITPRLLGSTEHLRSDRH